MNDFYFGFWFGGYVFYLIDAILNIRQFPPQIYKASAVSIVICALGWPIILLVHLFFVPKYKIEEEKK